MGTIIHRGQTSMALGEMSPQLYAHFGLDQYEAMARSLRDVFLTRFGLPRRRYGTRFIGGTKNNNPARLIPLTIKGVGTFIIEMNASVARIWFDEALVEDMGSPVELTTSITSGQLDEVQFAQTTKGQLILVHPEHEPRVIERAIDGTWSIDRIDTGFTGPKLDPRTKNFRLERENATTYNVLDDAEYFIVADEGSFYRWEDGYIEVSDVDGPTKMTVVQLIAPTLLTAAGDSSVDWLGPWAEADTSATQYRADDSGGVGNTVTITVTSGPAPTALDVGQILDINTNGSPIVGVIKEVTTSVEFELKLIKGSTTATNLYGNGQYYRAAERVGDNIVVTPAASTGSSVKISATEFVFRDGIQGVGVETGGELFINDGVWKVNDRTGAALVEAELLRAMKHEEPTTGWSQSWHLGTGFPRAVCFHQNRLCFGGFDQFPNTIALGRTGLNPFDFTLGDNDDDGMVLVLKENDVSASAVQWMKSGGDLLVGTEQAELVVSGQPLTPTMVGSALQTSHGGRNTQPLQVGPSVLFVSRCGCSVREMAFRFEQDRYVAPPLVDVSEHLFRSDAPILELAYFVEPEVLIFARRSDRTMRVLSLRRENGVVGWAIWSLDVRGMAVLPGPTNDELYVQVERTLPSVGGQRYIEAVNPDATMDSEILLTTTDYSGTWPTIQGLGHLQNLAVDVVDVDNRYRGQHTVTSGEITITDGEAMPASLRVGIPIECEITPQFLLLPAQRGDGLGRMVNLNRIKVRLNQAIGGTIDAGAGSHVLRPAPVAGEIPASFTGWVEIPGISVRDEEPVYTIRQNAPYDFQLLAVANAYEIGPD